jgi:hypothetical protein
LLVRSLQSILTNTTIEVADVGIESLAAFREALRDGRCIPDSCRVAAAPTSAALGRFPDGGARTRALSRIQCL